jgi:hypothetical protein
MTKAAVELLELITLSGSAKALQQNAKHEARLSNISDLGRSGGWNFCVEANAYLEQPRQNNDNQWTGAGSG